MPTRTIFATFALLLAPLTAQEKYTLRYDFQPNTTCWTQYDQDIAQQMDMGGQKVEVAMRTSVWMESKVTGVEKGLATITNRYARVKVNSDAPGMNVDYDSDVAGSDPGRMRVMADLVGKTATLQTDVRGKVVAMKMPDGLGPQFEQVAGSLKTSMEQSFIAWPEGPVAIGDTWRSNLEIPMQQMGSMKAVVTNKLLAVDGDVVNLDVAMSFDTSKLQMPAGMQMKAKDSTGTMRVSLQGAMPLESSMTMVFEMGMEDAAVMSMTMKQTMKQVPAPAPKSEPKAEPKKDAAGK